MGEKMPRNGRLQTGPSYAAAIPVAQRLTVVATIWATEPMNRIQIGVSPWSIGTCAAQWLGNALLMGAL